MSIKNKIQQIFSSPERRQIPKASSEDDNGTENVESMDENREKNLRLKKDVLCKFVVQKGQRIGETISIDSGNLVFKNQSTKMYVPISAIKEITRESVIVDEFDMVNAINLGEQWQLRTTKRLTFDEQGNLIND